MVGAMSVSTELVRPGRRVTLIDATVRDGAGVEVMRARALFARPGRVRGRTRRATAVPGSRGGRRPTTGSRAEPMFATHAVELRFVQGQLRRPGPVDRVVPAAVPMVAGEPVLGVERIAAAGDFGNGISSVLDWGRHSFINPDLTLYVERDPVDEWVALQSEMRVVQGSVAVAHERALGPARPDRPGGSVAARRRARARTRRRSSLQAKRLDPDVVGLRVAGVDAVRERLDDRQQRGVRAHERGRVGRVVEADPGQSCDL